MPTVSFGVRTPVRMLRLTLDTDNASSRTVKELRGMVARELAVRCTDVTLFLAPMTPALTDGQALSALGLDKRTLIATVPSSALPGAEASPSAAGAAAPSPTHTSTAARPSTATHTGTGAPTPAPTSPTVKLTPRCAHGPRGVCMHCLPAGEQDFEKMAAEPLNKAAAFAARHAEKSSAPEELTGEMEWLCRHRPDQMCVNCAPLRKGEKVHLEMLCQHGPDARCVNCLPPDSIVEDRKMLSYDEWLERKRARCEHSFSAVCVNCAPPMMARYEMKKGCGRHKPWPAGICLECAPQDVHLTLPEYRHVDNIAIANVDEFQRLSALWEVNAAAGVQRAGYLYGSIVADPAYRHGVRVLVQGIYEPPQRYDPVTGAITILADPNEGLVERVSKALGIQNVGWFFTRRPNEGGKRGLLPHELYAAAALQLKHPRADGRPGSQYVTLVMSRDETGGIVPFAYMASDVLMACVRDRVFEPPAPTDAKFKKRTPVAGEPPLPDIIMTDVKRGGRLRVTEVDPDSVTVTLEAAGKPSDALFKHFDFPVENRSEYRTAQSPTEVQSYLRRHGKEPYPARISDFHLLVFLASMLDVHTAEAAATAVARNSPLDEGVQLLLDAVATS